MSWLFSHFPLGVEISKERVEIRRNVVDKKPLLEAPGRKTPGHTSSTPRTGLC